MNQLNAVVTGGTRGIGLGIAESLVKRKASVAVTYHENDTAAESAKQRLHDLSHDSQKISLNIFWTHPM